MSRMGKSVETESRLMIASDWWREEWGVTAGGCEVSFQGDENVLEFMVIDAQFYEYAGNH